MAKRAENNTAMLAGYHTGILLARRHIKNACVTAFILFRFVLNMISRRRRMAGMP